MNKLKILYISSVIPDKSSGARIVIHRHLAVKQDFDVLVAGIDVINCTIDNKFEIKNSKLGDKLSKSRFARLYHNYRYIKDCYIIPAKLYEVAKKFNPDVILTIPDNLHVGFVLQLSSRLNKPLATNFQDLYPLSQFLGPYYEPYGWVRKFLLKKFHEVHDKSNVTYHVCEGMQDFFKKRENSNILYPIGDFNRPQIDIDHNVDNQDKSTITLVYAGNNYGSYGNLILKLAKVLKNSEKIKLKIYPVGRGWPESDIREMEEAGILQSFLPFEKLQKELKKADAFLTVMSFEEADKLFVTTSFTSKWLDYVPYGKPVIVWGPEYSSASIFAKKHQCGIVINSEDPVDVEHEILRVLNNSDAWFNFGGAARQLSDTILHPNNVHQVFVDGIKHVVGD